MASHSIRLAQFAFVLSLLFCAGFARATEFRSSELESRIWIEPIDRLLTPSPATPSPWKGVFYDNNFSYMAGGIQLPHHMRYQAWVMERTSYGLQAAELSRLADQAVKYLKYTLNLKGNTVSKTDGTVFIGHGGSPAWRDLKDFLQDRLGLEWDEFNRESPAGRSTKERLEAMLDKASFAFLVMTAEDERADGSTHARANVIHEAGLFQGRLGFERAIVLLEEGCSEFSNIEGLGQIRFPKGNIKARSEEIREVLERENIIK